MAGKYIADDDTISIYDYFDSRLDAPPGDDTLKDLPVNSGCGQKCKEIIDLARALLDACDDHRMVLDPILEGVEFAVCVCYHG